MKNGVIKTVLSFSKFRKFLKSGKIKRMSDHIIQDIYVYVHFAHYVFREKTVGGMIFINLT